MVPVCTLGGLRAGCIQYQSQSSVDETVQPKKEHTMFGYWKAPVVEAVRVEIPAAGR